MPIIHSFYIPIYFAFTIIFFLTMFVLHFMQYGSFDKVIQINDSLNVSTPENVKHCGLVFFIL